MTQFYTLEPLKFQPLSIHDRGVIQSITLAAGRRNCNFTFANLIGWQFWFGTERCILPHTVILRVRLFGDLCYMICSKEPPDMQLLKLLCLDASQFGDSLTLLALEDSHAEYLKRILPVQADINPRRNNYDYIYLRRDLEQLAGKHLKAKRNHVNKFLQLYPQYEYRPLSPQYFNDCRQLAQLWRDETDNTDHQGSVNAEQQVMENIYAHWDELDMIGGSIWIDGKMVAFKRVMKDGQYSCEMELLPLASVANFEKKIPLEWINAEHNFVTKELIDYVLPLIQGEPELPLEHSLPRYARLKKVLAE